MKKTLKRYIVRKYIIASSLEQALKKEPRVKVDDCWVDEDWKKDNPNQLESAIGFTMDTDEDYYEEYENSKNTI